MTHAREKTMGRAVVVGAVGGLLFLGACGESGSSGSGAGGGASSAASSPSAAVGSLGVNELLSRAKILSAEGREVEAAQLLDRRSDDLAEEERRELYPLMARYYHRASLLDKALSSAEAAVAAGHATPELLFIRGDSLRSQRRLTEARTQLEELLRREPGHLDGQLSLARVVLRIGDPREALTLLEKYLAALPTGEAPSRVASLDLGRALRAVKDYRRAADTFAELLVADPFDTVACSELAQTLYRRRLRSEGKFVEQIYKSISQNAFEEFVEEGLRSSGQTAFALGQKASNQVRQKRFVQAFANYEAALGIDGRDPRLRIFYAGLCARFRRSTAALRVLNEGLEAGVTPASGLWMSRAMIELEVGSAGAGLDSARAGLQALEREGAAGGVEKGQGSSLTLLLGVARGLLETGDPSAAQTVVERAATLHPGAWEPEYWRGRVELAQKRPAAAAEAFARARSRGAGEHFADLEYWSAVLLEEQGDPEGAAEKLTTLIQTRPGHEEAYESLLRIFERSGDGRKDALAAAHTEVAKKLRRIDELVDSIDGRQLADAGAEYLELGVIYRQLRDPVAFDYFFLASELLPRSPQPLEHLITAMSRPQDIFMRLQCLHRLHEIDPERTDVMAEIAGIYLRLGLRLDIARELAVRFHHAAPSAVSYRLVGEVELRDGNAEEGRRWLTDGLAEYPADARLRKALEESQSP